MAQCVQANFARVMSILLLAVPAFGEGGPLAGVRVFPPGVQIVASASASVADANRDGILDIIVSGIDPSGSPAIAILLGNGDGTFAIATRQALPEGVSRVLAMAIADCNQDGVPDIVLRIDGNRIAVLTGQGDGSFRPPVFSPIPDAASGQFYTVYRVVMGDLNGDSIPDLLTAGATTIVVMLGAGDGTFRSGATTGIEGNIPAFGLADFNGDGKIDLVGIDILGNRIFLCAGTGDGTFLPATEIARKTELGALQIADINADGKPDFVLTRGVVASELQVWYGNGDGTFRDQALALAPNSYPNGIATGDFDGDGRPDIAVLGTPALLAFDEQTIELYRADETGMLNHMLSLRASGILVTGDFNGDGLSDIADGDVGIHLATGGGAFEKFPDFDFGFVRSRAVGDFNGDGAADVAVTGPGPTAIFLSDRATLFTQMPVPNLPGRDEIVAGDFRRRGKLDLFVTEVRTGRYESILPWSGGVARRTRRWYVSSCRDCASGVKGERLPLVYSRC